MLATAPVDTPVYRHVLELLQSNGIEFSLGGAVALCAYTGRWRATKDIDLYIVEEDFPKMEQLLAAEGFRDYYEVRPYDRKWIHRRYFADALVDVIWSMANLRAKVTRSWLSPGPVMQFQGVNVRILRAEELIWTKLYVLQSDRSDWPDIFNVLSVSSDRINFRALAANLGKDIPLMGAVLQTFRWIDPDAARKLPDEVWTLFDAPVAGDSGRRAQLLDSRDWYVAMESKG